MLETLVVIGIVLLLVGILLPVLTTARRSAVGSACLADQRSIGLSAVGRATDHGGYLPLAGMLVLDEVPAVPGDLPRLLSDPGRKRYAYTRERAGFSLPEQVVPFQAALLAYMEPEARPATENGGVSGQELADAHVAARLFTCRESPTSASSQSLHLLRRRGDFLTLASSTVARYDFAPNEAVVGFDVRYDASQGRARGLLARVVDPSTTALTAGIDRTAYPMFEAGTSSVTSWYAFWSPDAGPLDAPLTLVDAVRGERADANVTVDRKRHGGRVEVLYADGHAELVASDAESLRRVALRH